MGLGRRRRAAMAGVVDEEDSAGVKSSRLRLRAASDQKGEKRGGLLDQVLASRPGPIGAVSPRNGSYQW